MATTYSVDFKMFGTAYVEASSREEAIRRLTDILGAPVATHWEAPRPAPDTCREVWFNSSDRPLGTDDPRVKVAAVATTYGFIEAEVTEAA